MDHSHYNEAYFEWQKKSGSFAAEANRLKFLEFASEDLRILDFGCGGGYMLKGLPAKEKLGIEINPSARQQAEKNGVKTVSTISEVEDHWADLVISDHALEHVDAPLKTLIDLKKKVKPNGKVVFYVPCENIDMPYDPQDHNQHLYSWGPQSFGNLFKLAGYNILSSEPFFHKHFLYCHHFRRVFGTTIFNWMCNLNGKLNYRKSNEVRLIAVP
jgi:SAM-dependent methyltransferase